MIKKKIEAKESRGLDERRVQCSDYLVVLIDCRGTTFSRIDSLNEARDDTRV